MIIVLLATTIFTSGCSCLLPSPMPYGPKVTSDGSGGAIVAYEDIKRGNQHDFYVQKISPEGAVLWGDKGILVGSGYKYWDSFHDLHIVSDGYGGAIVSWVVSPSRPESYATYLSRVNATGTALWQKEVLAFDDMTIISDGAGGAIIASEYGETVWIIKIDSEGIFPWGEPGVSLRAEDYSPHSLGLVSDGAEGAIVVWQEAPEVTDRIFAQRIDAKGKLPWGQSGVLLYTAPEEVRAEEPRLISDGAGGAIAVWTQEPEGIIEEGSPEALLFDIYAQRVDADGEVLWADNGISLLATTSERWGYPGSGLVVSDGTGGAMVIRGEPTGTYAQKINADGEILWQSGRKVSSSSSSMAASDGRGGAIVTLGTRAQRIDATGRTVWPDDGILFTQRGNYTLAGDGQGGAIIAWGNGKSTLKSESSCVQRIDSSGRLLWGAKGIRLIP